MYFNDNNSSLIYEKNQGEELKILISIVDWIGIFWTSVAVCNLQNYRS